jgi:hypothetical protein
MSDCGPEGGRVLSSKTSALEGVSGQRHAPAAIYPQERPCTHRTESWVGPKAGLDGRKYSSPPPEFDPRTVQPVVSRYTDWATRPTLYRDKRQIR